MRRLNSCLLGNALLVVMSCVGLSCGGQLHVGGAPRLAEQLPIRRVVLYQNGVGYFERQGEVEGDAITLHCRPHQINDLLKSLTVIDQGSGRPVSVSLPLEKHGAKVLAELPKQVREASGLLDVLRVFRGARVRVEGQDGTVSGRVVGVEQGLLEVAEKAGGVTGWRLTIKTDDEQLVVYAVKDIKRLLLMDRALQVGLERSLDVSLDEGAWKPVALTVRLAGDSDHKLLVSYIVEMPNWKPAYRLVVPTEGRRPLLQGWSVIDNVSGEGWYDVQLSLVAGTPMSFVYDLHTPRFTRRVDLTPRGVHTALAPTRELAGIAEERDEPAESAKEMLQSSFAKRRAASPHSLPGRQRPAMKMSAPAAPLSGEAIGGVDAIASPKALNQMLERQVETNVTAAQVGGLSRYDLGDPVTVPDSSSTLVNIVNSRVSGNEVVLFRPELTRRYGSAHPYRAVMFSNDTGLALEKGPVTIYSGGTFVGEGFLERMEPGASIFLTFAIDGNVTMKRSESSGQEAVKLLRIRGSRIESEVLRIDRRHFEVRNQHDKAITAYVKSIAPNNAYKLRHAPKGVVTTPEATYVPVEVPAGGKAKLIVEWVSPIKRWLAIDTDMAKTVLKLYSSRGNVPKPMRPLIDEIVSHQDRIGAIDSEMRRISNLKRELNAEQERIRANLELLRKVKGNTALKTQLTRQMAKLESRLAGLTSSYIKLDEEKATLRAKVRILIGQINLDAARK